jgi:hypothetical protein
MVFYMIGWFQGVRELLKKCVIVPGEDRLSLQANDNATILFQCLIRYLIRVPTVRSKNIYMIGSVNPDPREGTFLREGEYVFLR